MNPPRTFAERQQDTLKRLEDDVDVWVSTADGGMPYLVPLSFLWDENTLLISTAASNPTGRNLLANGQVRLSIGPTRDVVLIEGTAEVTELSDEVADAFAVKTGFDPRRSAYPYFRVRPRLIQAWREVNELKDRDLMRDGEWLS